MFGTWQLTRRGQLAHGGLATGEGLQDAQALGVAEALGRRRLSAADRSSVVGWVPITRSILSLLAQERKCIRAGRCAPRCAVPGRAYSRRMPDPSSSLDAIAALRERVGGRDPSHADAVVRDRGAVRPGAPAGASVADGRLYLKAEHLQKTGSFKPRAALTRISSLTADERARGAITISAGQRGPGLRVGGIARPACR